MDDAAKFAARQVRQRVNLVCHELEFLICRGERVLAGQTQHNLVTMAIPDTPNMACPYFMPVEKLENGTWPHPSRLPLGSGWRGYCTAPGHEGDNPANEVLESCCNLGYADRCSWAPRDRSSDAVRFAVIAPNAKQPSKADKARSPLRIHFVCERDHRPQSDGELEFDLARSIWVRSHQDSRIQKMAECFLASYLQKKV